MLDSPFVPKEEVGIYEKNLKHIFRDSKGHFPKDTYANRKLIIETASNSKNYVGKDKFGSHWHTQMQADGRQTWTCSRNGQIRNAGINNKPKTISYNYE